MKGPVSQQLSVGNRLRCLLQALQAEFGWSQESLNPAVVDKKLARWAASRGIDLQELVAAALGHDSVRPTLWELAGALSVNETYFFRGRHQLEWVVREAVPERLRSRNRAVLWSAGCSSGEEVYSLLFLAAEEGTGSGEEVFEKMVVFGTDVDECALERAQQGVYSERSFTFRATDRAVLKRFFEPLGGGLHRVKEEYRGRAFFVRDNLAGAESPFLPGTVDVCLCRNVLYYMTADGRRKALRKIARALAAGGYLLLGEREVVEEQPELGLQLLNSGGVTVLRKGG
mgnify:CR=1 FL=1